MTGIVADDSSDSRALLLPHYSHTWSSSWPVGYIYTIQTAGVGFSQPRELPTAPPRKVENNEIKVMAAEERGRQKANTAGQHKLA
ncbi:hypothetical protein PoB_000167200 [Plakobranchus ocellatus]|uniref:Uncharacterized protein n=1 Tax=Plakobranchus ocellatus TaxID=259542 RepID=A0AAV3XXH2_9GAST|nr:hypothetical protein PoB_000167200 [Plakobranchus ocellatus]